MRQREVGVKHSASAKSASVRRTTSPTTMSSGCLARRIPPLRPRTVSTYSQRLSSWTTFIKWFSEIPWATAISPIVARRPVRVPKYIKTRKL